MTTDLQARLQRIRVLHEEHHPGMSILDMGYVRWPEIDACAGILVGVKAPYIAALLNEWPNIADEIARLEKQSTRLNDDRNEIRRELQGVQIKADALTEEVERLDGAIESPPKPMMDWIMEQSVKFAGCPRPSKLKHQTGRGLAKAILLLAGQYLRNEAALTDYQGDGK